MPTLTEFLLARIGEVEAEVAAFDEEWGTTTVAGPVPIGLAYITDTEYMQLLVEPAHVLAECEAKRAAPLQRVRRADPARRTPLLLGRRDRAA
jgi:hypothetical protein